MSVQTESKESMTLKNPSINVQASATTPTKEVFMFPLSFGQRRLWFLNQLDPLSPAYNIPIPMRFNSSLNRLILERAVNELVRRHEILRTSFQMVNGEPMQVVAPSLEITVAYSDLCSTPTDQKDAVAANLAALDAQRPFSLSETPLIRVGLHRLGKEDHLLLISMHHIVSDGWSVGVLFRELNALYSAFSSGSPSPLLDLQVQYADFAHWQSQTLKGATLQKLLSYWKQQFVGAPKVLKLPFDRIRPAVPSGRGGAHGITISASLYQSIRSLSQREGATPFMTLLAIFQTLLFRHTGEVDLVIGTPIANRTKPQLENLIGLFVNTLIIRADLSGEPTFLELLARVRETALGAYAHQDMPFELLVEELQPSRSLDHNPLFQVMFLLQSTDPSDVTQTDSHHTRPIHITTSTAKFDLTVSVAEVGQAANVTVEYNADLFDEGIIKQLTNRFIILIESVVSEPNTKLSALQLCSAAELRALQPIIGPKIQPAEPTAVWECVAHWADTQPNEIAITVGTEAITYRDLDARVEDRVRELLAQSIPKNGLVEVCLNLSIEMFVMMLAVGKANAVFVPFVLGAKTNLTHDENPCIDNDVACILHLQESEFCPKGARIPHRALNRTSFGQGLHIMASDCIVHCAQFEDEFSIFEIFAALAAGAHLVILPADPAPPPRKLANLLRDYQATITIAPMDTLNRVARDFPWALETVLVVVTHEQVTTKSGIEETLLQKLFQVDGAAEVGGYSFIRPPGNSVPSALGAVAAGVTVHLLDGAMRPVPVGAVGEIFYESSYLAKGYHDNPVSTTEWFPNSFHRSGQLAYRDQNDNLIACGRHDRRIRNCGVRIELEVVEAVLLQHPNIEKVAVVQSSPGLTAFVVAAVDSSPPSEKDLMALFQEGISPAAMPTTWRIVEDLPLTPYGQIDLNRLHSMASEFDSGASKSEYVAPRNDIEIRLAKLWGTIFGVTQIGIHDDFFRLGGHSLLATRITMQIADEFDVVLSLRDFFSSPTIEGLSVLIGRNESESAKLSPSVITPSDIGPTDRVADVAQLSDEDVDDMLAVLLKEQLGMKKGKP
jgi:non-ribosomal peptide synthetase component F/acyl carrier protein